MKFKLNKTLLLFFMLLTISFAMMANMYSINGQAEDDDIIDPVAVIKPFSDFKIGDQIEFNGNQSYDPGNTDNVTKGIIEWTWFIRDHGQNLTNQAMMGSGQVLPYVIHVPGNYIVNLTVTDEVGLMGSIEKILVVSGPDLQVISLTFQNPSDDDLKEGDHPNITVAYNNIGTVEINSSWQIVITDNGERVIDETIDHTIAPGETYYFNFSSYKLKAGDRHFSVTLDYNSDVAEMDGAVNYLDVNVNVKEKTDPPNKDFFLIIIIIAIVIVSINAVIITSIIIQKKHK